MIQADRPCIEICVVDLLQSPENKTRIILAKKTGIYSPKKITAHYRCYSINTSKSRRFLA